MSVSRSSTRVVPPGRRTWARHVNHSINLQHSYESFFFFNREPENPIRLPSGVLISYSVSVYQNHSIAKYQCSFTPYHPKVTNPVVLEAEKSDQEHNVSHECPEISRIFYLPFRFYVHEMSL